MSQESASRRRDGVLGGIGRACYRHRRLTLLSWILGVACLITLWTRFGAAADNTFTGSDPGQTLLNQHFHRQSGDTLLGALTLLPALLGFTGTRLAKPPGCGCR